MSLPLSDLVQVDIAVSPTLAPLAGFGELLFMTDDVNDLKVISVAERMRKFGSLGEVMSAFSTLNPNSECIAAAKSFYSQSPKPKHFTVGVMAKSAYNGSLVGGQASDLEVLKTLSGNAMTFDLNGTSIALNLTLTSATDMNDVAVKLQAAIRASSTSSSDKASVTVAFTGSGFVVTTGATGSNQSVGYFKDTSVSRDGVKADFDLPLDSNLSLRSGENAPRLLGLDKATALRSVEGGNAETIDVALSECWNIATSFVGIVLSKFMRDIPTYISGANGAAGWCEASKRLFMNTTNDFNVFKVSAHASTEAYKLKNKSLRFTITSFGRDEDEYPSASLFGRIATVNYEGDNTVISTMFKKLPNITALALTESDKVAMEQVNVGGFMNFGGNLMYANGRMADNGWLDTVHGLMWLEDRIQKGVFNLMYGTTTKIPYTDTGIGMVEQKVAGALEQARANGLIAAGNTPEGQFLPNGWEITAKGATEVAAEDKSNRLYRGITFKAVGAGALQNVIISGSFSE